MPDPEADEDVGLHQSGDNGRCTAGGANNVADLIPRHRVVRSDGSVGGYAYGLEIKRELLAREEKRHGAGGGRNRD